MDSNIDVVSKQLSNNTNPESSSIISINDGDSQHKSVQSGRSIDSTSSESLKKLYDITSFDVWAMGITIVMGGQYFSWNAGFSAGFGSFAIAAFLVGFAYISLIFCICEITSALPFSGGSYGLARCTQGNYFGFVLGSLEAIQYIFYVASSSYSLGTMITMIEPQMIGYEPIIWLIFYLFSLSIFIFGGKYFWRFNTFLAIISILILLLFSFGSLHYVDFNQYAAIPNETGMNKWFVGGMTEFMKVLPLAAWLFVGVESLKMMCDDMPKAEASTQVPRGQISCVFTLFLTMILVLFITPSLPPGIMALVTNAVPFDTGFQLMFALTDEQTERYATILSIPATFATAFGFILMYGKIIVSMANSKLFPSFLNSRYSITGAPYAALIFGSFLSYICCLVVFYYEYFGLQLFNICILSAFLAYICQIIGYINMKSKFKYVKRNFVSPLGITGAVFSLFVWLLGIVSVIAFQDDSQFALIVLAIIITVLSVWYFLVAKKQQSFSDEEKNILFNIHVINHNLKKKKKKRVRKNSEGVSVGSGCGMLMSGVSVSNFSRQSSTGSKNASTMKKSSVKNLNNKSNKSSSSENKSSGDGGDDVGNSVSDISETYNSSAAIQSADIAAMPSSLNRVMSYRNGNISHRLLSNRNKVGIELFNNDADMVVMISVQV